MSPKLKLLDYGILAKETVNMSTSVYLYSIHLANVNLNKNPFGSGLSNYELTFKHNIVNDISELSIEYNKPTLDKKKFPLLNPHILPFNNSDGSINFSKILVEYGVISILLSLYLIYRLFVLKGDNEFKIYTISILFPQIFVRGSGFFYNGFLIMLILCLIHLTIKNEND